MTDQPLFSHVWFLLLERFLNGEDTDMDYASIDNNDNLDDVKIREHDEEEKYFDDEAPFTYDDDEL